MSNNFRNYNITQMAEDAETNTCLSENKEFFSEDITIRVTKDKGRCVIAKRNLQKSELIVVSKAVTVVENSETEEYLPYLLMNLSKEIEKSQNIGDRVYGLVAGPSFPQPQQNTKNIDFSRLLNICTHNSFSGENFNTLFPSKSKNDPKIERCTSGLWIEPAYINHSCVPNCNWFCVGDYLFMITIQNIQAGEEIVHCYADVMNSYSERTLHLEQYEFECDCARCIYFRDNEDESGKEDEMYERLSNISHTTWETSRDEAEAYLQLINDVKKEFKEITLEYTALLWQPMMSLSWLYCRLGDYEKCILYGLEAGKITTKWYGEGCPSTIRTYFPVVKAYKETGKVGEAKQLLDSLLLTHVSRYGTSSSHFKNCYNNTLLQLNILELLRD